MCVVLACGLQHASSDVPDTAWSWNDFPLCLHAWLLVLVAK